MRKKRDSLFFVCLLVIIMAACKNGAEKTVLSPTDAAEATAVPQEMLTPAPESASLSTPTSTPTLTPTPSPVPTATPTPKVKDTYKPGTLTDDSFSSEWMDLRFTNQPGLLFGTEEGIEMYAQSMYGARVEVYTELIPEEDLDMQDVYYLSLMMDNLLDEDYKIFDQSSDFSSNIGNEHYAGIIMTVADAAGNLSYKGYVVRKKEARMIILSISCPISEVAYNSMVNIVNCFNGYHSEPVVLPEGTFGNNVFQEGVFTENRYENEWINLRITLPEEGILTKNETASVDSVYFDAYINEVACANFYIFYFGRMQMTTGEYLLQSINSALAQEQFENMMAQGYTANFSKEVEISELGGQEYEKVFLEITDPNGTVGCVELYAKLQDNYMVFVTMTYEKGSGEREKLLSTFSTY
ncbi:MAG: hypothetical protein IKL28_02090 [Lachnospiraceae bacterium]|nr:hypothetical protein [Lachnospiraceae bacterium]